MPTDSAPHWDDAVRTGNVADPVPVRFSDGGSVPNNPDLTRGAVPPDAGGPAIRALFQANGWRDTWIWTVSDYHHYHPNAHEVLGVVPGWSDLELGGPGGEMYRLEAGDVVVLPAGTGHRRGAASEGFAVCGGYPPEQTDPAIQSRATGPRGDAVDRIARVARPATDPVLGRDGPLTRLWARAARQ